MFDSEKHIQYKSSQKNIITTEYTLDSSERNGVRCVWSSETIAHGSKSTGIKRLSWQFNWSTLKSQGFDGLCGRIVVKPGLGNNDFTQLEIGVDTKESMQVIEKVLVVSDATGTACAEFEYNLVAYRISTRSVSYEEMFSPSDLNDAVLLVDGKQLHVNKTFLSYHSEYFRALFSSNYREKHMNEIPIEDITFEDFGLLLSSFYPNPIFPNDNIVEKLLELADRFLVPSVVNIAEYHLFQNTEIENAELMLIADKYSMPKVLEKTIRKINTIEEAKRLKRSSEYSKLSKDAKACVLDKLLQLL